MNPSLPRLLQLASPALPVGAYTYSQGLEWAVESGRVHDQASALAWIAVLSRLDLSVAYPFLALNFVLVTLVARFFLGESVPPLRWLGILVIIGGILLVAKSTTTVQ